MFGQGGLFDLDERQVAERGVEDVWPKNDVRVVAVARTLHRRSPVLGSAGWLRTGVQHVRREQRGRALRGKERANRERSEQDRVAKSICGGSNMPTTRTRFSSISRT